MTSGNTGRATLLLDTTRISELSRIRTPLLLCKTEAVWRTSISLGLFSVYGKKIISCLPSGFARLAWNRAARGPASASVCCPALPRPAAPFGLPVPFLSRPPVDRRGRRAPWRPALRGGAPLPVPRGGPGSPGALPAPPPAGGARLGSGPSPIRGDLGRPTAGRPAWRCSAGVGLRIGPLALAVRLVSTGGCSLYVRPPPFLVLAARRVPLMRTFVCRCSGSMSSPFVLPHHRVQPGSAGSPLALGRRPAPASPLRPAGGPRQRRRLGGDPDSAGSHQVGARWP